MRWKGCTAEEDTWENKENFKNASKLVKEFEKQYGREEEKKARQQETEESKRVFSRELPEKYTEKLLYR